MRNHYKWLEVNLPKLYSNLGLDTTYCDSIIAAHGDKCYSAETLFEKNGIHFYHGCAMYLLARMEPYNNEVRDTPNGWVDPFQRVINNIDRFSDHLPAI